MTTLHTVGTSLTANEKATDYTEAGQFDTKANLQITKETERGHFLTQQDKYYTMDTGKWANKEGKGFLKYDNGSEYHGDFKDGKEHGDGVHIFPNGDKYEGEFK